MAILGLALGAQTVNVKVGQVTYQFPAAQVGDMSFADGTTLTVMDRVFNADEISGIYLDAAAVTDNLVTVAYDGISATVTVAGNVARYVTATVSGAHVSIAQSDDVGSDNTDEITYVLTGSTTDGEFYLTGSYKTSVELNGVTIVNATPVYSGAAINIQNGKRINVTAKSGTVNTLTDAADGSQKACFVIKGHGEFKGHGTLNINGQLKHGIKTGEYMSVKNCTINVLSAPGDGIHCNEFFLMESGTIDISGVEDDGIQVELDGTTSTGETIDHDGEDSSNIYILDGTITIAATAIAAKGIKTDGDISVAGGSVTATTSGKGKWDSDDNETKAAAGLSCKGNIIISDGNLTLTSTGSGGKGAKCDGAMTINGGTITVNTSGGLYYHNGRTEYTNYTGDTDRINSSYYSSPKGLKATDSITIAGGVINVTCTGNNGEGIESKSTINIIGGTVYSCSRDDAINSASTLTVSGGSVCAYSTGNDGLDANGNCYIKGGLIYAIGKSSPEVAIDANTERGYKLYVEGGTLVAIGGLERGSTLTQSCYSSTTWNRGTWYALYNDDTLALAFKTPANGGSPLVVSTSSTPTLRSSVTVNEGTELWNGMAKVGATVEGGRPVTLSSYTGNNGGGGPPW